MCCMCVLGSGLLGMDRSAWICENILYTFIASYSIPVCMCLWCHGVTVGVDVTCNSNKHSIVYLYMLLGTSSSA